MSGPTSASGKKSRPKRPSPRRRPPRRRARELRARHKRATRRQFVDHFSLRELAVLPLPWPSDTLPGSCPKRRFRSWYRPRSRRSIRRFFGRVKAHPGQRPSFFETALHLIDFSSLRSPLVALTLTASARGQDPFDPLSLLLVCLWKVEEGLPWTQVATRLAHPQKGALWRRLCGFFPGNTPGESTLRAFRDRLPDTFLNRVQKSFLALLHRAGLLPPSKPQGYTIVGDGQLHEARSRHRCHHATATCFQPVPRPCPADQATAGRYSCACDTAACQERCALAPHRDRQAAFIIYSRQERRAGQPTVVHIHKAVFGYRSMAARLVDPRFHCAWNIHTDLLPANADEGSHFPPHFRAACENLPEKRIGDVIYDSACGEQACLDAVYDLGGIPLFDVRADASDGQTARWAERGYDDHGHPLCHQGLPLTFQGIDRSRAQPRARWVCLQACRRLPQGEVPGCPYLKKRRGQYVYVGRTLPDGSYRLARLVPHGTRLWKKRTAWRNTSESRNSSLESRGLLRFPDYGRSHGAFLVLAADVLEDLCTLARLVYEATLLDDRFQPLQEGKRTEIPANIVPIARQEVDQAFEEVRPLG
jgi:hypothetical protein